MTKNWLRRLGLFLGLGCFLLPLVSGCSALGRIAVEPAPASTTAPTPEPIYNETFEALWNAVDDNYVYADFGGVDWENVHDETLPEVQAATSDEKFAELMKAMVAALPQDTVIYETRAERLEAETGNSNRYEGIGAFVGFRAEPEPRVILLSIVPDSPADRAGLQDHDSILAIDGVPVRVEEGLAAVERVRGPAGSEVVLTIRSLGEESREVTVRRGQLSATDQLEAALIPNTRIVHFPFPSTVYENLVADFANAYQTFSLQGLDGLVLDLRVARGQVGWPLEVLVTAFADGDLGEFYTRQEATPVTIEGQDIAGSQSLPIAILVGPDTDGLPEVFAAMMQATGRAKIIGLPTKGEIEGFSEFQLPDGSRALLITSSFRTPDGLEVGLTGITADIPVEADWDAVTPADDPVLEAAIQWLSEQR
jgi:carboxyl-terminal processing protease